MSWQGAPGDTPLGHSRVRAAPLTIQRNGNGFSSRECETASGWYHRIMRSGEFDELLRRSGLSRAALARRLGLHVNTVSNWGDEAPEYALAYLRLLVRVRELVEDL